MEDGGGWWSCDVVVRRVVMVRFGRCSLSGWGVKSRERREGGGMGLKWEGTVCAYNRVHRISL